MNETIKVKNCPFCGKFPEYANQSKNSPFYGTVMHNCPIIKAHISCDLESWNKRNKES